MEIMEEYKYKPIYKNMNYDSDKPEDRNSAAGKAVSGYLNKAIDFGAINLKKKKCTLY